MNPNTLSNAGSIFREAFLTCSLGLVRQLGVADTKPLLQFLAKRYLHTLLDPNVNHDLIEQYVYPSQLKSPVRWTADWAAFQNQYLVLPKGWSGSDTSGDIRGVYNLTAVSHLTDINVDGYPGKAAWEWFKSTKPYQDYSRWSPK